MIRHVWIAFIVLAAGAAAGCTPVTVSFTLGGEGRQLSESTVARDRNAGSAKVALIDVRGILADQSSGFFGTGDNPVDELAARLDKAAEDRHVRAVVLRINSPGGGVTASDMMYREVRRFREQTGKPVIASLGEVAASGGYYLALAADEIIAEPTSITASIGVIIPTVNVSEGLGRIGVRARNLTSGPNKDMGDPLTPPREAHYAILQDLVDQYYDRFRALVTERRPSLTPDQAGDMTDGRVITGARAVHVGLADTEGGVREAFDAAKRLGEIPGARLVKYHSRGTPPRSPYGGANSPAAKAAGEGTEINFMQVNLPALGWTTTPGAYYLWAPGLE